MTEQQESSGEAMTTRIGQAVILLHGGDREEARNRLTDLWRELGEDGDLFHRLTVAHYMADTQEDAHDELAWDLRALAAADALTTDEVAREGNALAVRALYPSLYLNLSAAYLKVADTVAARQELDRCRACLGELDDDAYGAGVRAAADRMERRLAEASGPTAPRGPHPP
ncbi:hypothetical protein V1J52_21350 [Streptomyces sp. TRM 70351]|uniref:hypothetical protein n=1 Tax=Streptomyces sp. TRM 70351 TaxID=3116552 RepID=UPI002E7B590B|nr:hypothetical protein [Streptomyces sp. TRM 70351]MEE1930703.1 hypothetical protein [Streptomyces sp. TRM 70351]